MPAPKDITHCFAFDKVTKHRNRKHNIFLKITYILLTISFAAQLVFFLI